MPQWLTYLSGASLLLAALCAIWCAVDVVSHRQHMWIMNLVWPITVLWAGPFGLWAYYRIGRLSTYDEVMQAKARGETPPGQTKPHWLATGLGTTHSGAGCTLGDVCAESFMYFAVANTWLGLSWELYGRSLFAGWAIDYVLAFGFGILFQYFTIKPMKGLSPGRGLLEAIKADTLSLTAWQLGMYGWMAIATFAIFGHELDKTAPVFWFMLQIAMVAGFVTSYPVNWWLLRVGIKEKM
jgi:hypothetical protein